MKSRLIPLLQRLRGWRRPAPRAETLLSAAMDSSDEGILIIGQNGGVLAMNRRFRELWRIPGELADAGQDKALLAFVLDQLIDPEQFLGKVRQLYGSEAEARDVLHFKDGRVFARHTRPLPAEAEKGRIWCFRDVSEQAHAEQALRASEQKLLDILDNVDACIYLKDTEGRYLFANRAARELWHARMDDIVGHGDEKFFDAPTAANIRENDRRVLKGGETVRAEEVNTVPMSGKTIIYQSTKLPLRREDGNIYALCGISVDITERKEAERRLVESEARLRTVIETEPECIKLVDAQGRLLHMNPAGLRMIEADSLEQVRGRQVLDLVVPEYRAAFAEMHKRVIAGNAMQMVFEIIGLKGGRRYLETHAVPMPDSGKTALLGITRDITARREDEERLHLAAKVFTHAREGIMITAADGTIIDVNDAFTTITGYGRAEVIGRNPRMLSSGRQDPAYFKDMWRKLSESGSWDGEVWNRRKNGEIFVVMQTVSAVRDAEGKVRQYVALFSDITRSKQHEAQLERIAHYDSLTALPNRLLFADRLRQAMFQAQRRQQRLAVIYLDLDGFKAINDRHGHDAGDMLLMHVANHMKHALREGDTLARLGGDEFVAVLPDLVDITASIPLLTRLLHAAAQPVTDAGLTLQVSASLGITFFPQTEDVDADQLLRQADQAMYQAKLSGKNRYHVFDAEHDRSVRGRHDTLERIRLALNNGEFMLHYQPKVNMRSGIVAGAEALIRWRHPERGLLLPADFLPATEDSPLAIEIGEWVIDTALTQIESWRAVGLDIPVSVNISAQHLQQANFTARLRELLAAHPRVVPSRLALEVLETSALEDIVLVSQLIEDCRDIGVSFSLDDFGTGYSSLTYLKRLPVDEIKIDQSFVCDMLHDPEDLAIVEGVLSFATVFHRRVVAEGVESEKHGALLLQLGSELAQGYGIAHPMPAGEVPAWVADWQPYPAWRDLATVSRDDLPLLVAGVEHRAWINAMGSHLRDELDAPPTQDHHACRFGQWMDTAGHERHGTQPDFIAIDALHQRVHALANELLRLKSCGRNEEALAKLDELHGLRDELFGALMQLLAERQPH